MGRGGEERREGIFFEFVSRILRMGERVDDFFHSSQNKEICKD